MPVASVIDPANGPASPVATLAAAYVTILGLLVGSYLNVVVYRLPRRLSTVLPRSRCPRCRAPIRPWDNVPILSWLLLRGRCRRCGVRISWRYPAIEAATGALFLGAFLRFERPREMAVAALFSAAMLALAMIDLEHFLLPDAITKTGIAAGLLLQGWIALSGSPPLAWATPPQALFGALVGGGLLWAVSWTWYLWRGLHGLGMGDVKLMAMVGAFLGWQGVAVTLFLGSLAGSLVGLALLLGRRLRLGSKLPFGFFLGLAAIVAVFWGYDLLAAYVGEWSARQLWAWSPF